MGSNANQYVTSNVGLWSNGPVNLSPLPYEEFLPKFHELYPYEEAILPIMFIQLAPVILY